jgi:membrane protease YdiL (CAAX protease family)
MAFALSWGLGGIALLCRLPLAPGSPLYFLCGYAVSAAGLYFLWREGQMASLRERLALRGILLPIAGCAGVYGLIGMGSVTTTMMLLDTGPLGEELGWRGFALPRLIAHHGAIRATLILGVIHCLWHAPLFLIPGMPQAHLPLLWFAAEVLSLSVIQTAMHLASGGNLWVAMAIHAFANWAGAAAGVSGFVRFTVHQTIFAILLLPVLLRWGKGSQRPAIWPG